MRKGVGILKHTSQIWLAGAICITLYNVTHALHISVFMLLPCRCVKQAFPGSMRTQQCPCESMRAI